MRLFRAFVLLLAFFAVRPCGAEQPSPSVVAYAEGLDHMASARWKEAAASFATAIQADPENATYFTARGVAHTLAENFPAGLKDFERSLRLRPNDRETQVWQGACARLRDQYDMTASMVYGGTAPREYAIFVFNDLVIEYWRPGNNAGTDEKSRAHFPRAGAWFADLAMGRGGMESVLMERARAQVAAKEFEGALATIARLSALRPDDNDVLRLEGFARLGYGDADTARATFTRLLTAIATDGDGYAGRAMARARLGDYAGADKDLEHAKSHKSARVDEARKAVAEAKATSTGRDRAAATLLFFDAAKADEPWDDLVAKAVDVRRASNAERRRWDERYQDRLRALEKALADKPGNVDRMADLAQFLYDNADVRGEQVEPRAGWRGYRWQTEESKKREIARAEELVDRALAASPDHLRALGLKVRLRLHHERNADAVAFYDRMVALGANDPASKVVFAEMMDAIAWQKAREAADLRARDGRVEYFGDWMTTYSLTPEGWRQVRELEALADRFAKMAESTLEDAAKALKGTPRGHYYQGKVHLRRGENEQAKAEFEKAVAKDGEFAEAWDLLGTALARLGDAKGAFQCRVKAWNRFETSAGLILAATRDLVAQTRFASARNELDAALAVDPADARVYAYRAMTFDGDENHAEAFRWYRAALAMEEARARLQGTTYGEGGRGTRVPGDFGLSMAARERMAVASKLLGRPVRERIDLARASRAAESRILPADWTAPVHSYMIPRYDGDPTAVPAVPEAIELLARARVAAGDALREGGDPAAAEAEYAAAFDLDARFREFVVNRADNYGLRDALHRALVGRGHALLALDRYDEALDCERQPPQGAPPADGTRRRRRRTARRAREVQGRARNPHRAGTPDSGNRRNERSPSPRGRRSPARARGTKPRNRPHPRGRDAANPRAAAGRRRTAPQAGGRHAAAGEKGRVIRTP